MADPDKVRLGKTDKFSSLVNSQLTSMRQGGTLTDFVITVQGEEEKIHCHKVVLAIHSSYFLTMFTSDVGEATKDSVHYKHITIDIAKLVVDYMYYEEIEFDTDQLMDIIQTCDYMQIKALKERCINEAKASIQPRNVLAWLRFSAEESVKKSDIKSWCLKSIRTNFAEISQQEAFLRLTYAELHECVTEVKKSDVNRDIILCAVFRWASDDTASRNEHLKELVPLIQLENCSLPAILNVMDTYKSIIGPNVELLGMLTKSMIQMTTSQVDKPEASATLSQKTLVVIGGNDNNNKVNRQCWSLVPKANKFSKLCTIPFDDLCHNHSVCQIPEGIAITGGVDSTLFAVFFASTRSWMKLQNLRRNRHLHASICIQGTLYDIGGVVDGSQSASVECFTLEGGQWEDGPSLPVAIAWPIAAELNNSAYVIDQSSKKLQQLDVAKTTWIPRAALPCGYNDFSMAAVNGRLCAAGGDPRITAWYTPDTDTWCMGKQQPKEKHFDGCLVQNDSTTLLLLGGSNLGGTDVIEELNMTDGSWSTKEYKMPAELCYHKAFMLHLPQE